MTHFVVRPFTAQDQSWVPQFMRDHWGEDLIVSRQGALVPSQLPGFVAQEQHVVVGVATYRIRDDECEIVTIDNQRPASGVGTALIEAVIEAARQAQCRRIWLTTTNDNTHALRFYQKRGFVLAALYRNAVEEARRKKPRIPLWGNDGIPIRDEIELEMVLNVL